MIKSLSLILVALSSYALSLPVVCSAIKSNDLKVAQAVNQEANVLEELLEVPEFRTAYLNGEYDADESKDEFDILYAVESGYTGNSPYSLYLYVWNKSGKGSDIYNFVDRYNSISIYSVDEASNNNYNIRYINRSKDNRFIKYYFPIDDASMFINTTTGSREYGITGIQIGKFNNGLVRYIDYVVAKKWNFRNTGDEEILTYYDTFEVLDDIHLSGGAYNYGDWKEPVRCSDGSYIDGQAYQHLYYVYFSVPKIAVDNNELYSVHADYYDFDFSDKLIGFYSGFDKASVDNDWGISDPAYLVGYGLTPGYDIYNLHYVHRYSSLVDNYPIVVYLNSLDDLTQNISGHLVSETIDRHTAYNVTGQSKSDVYKNIHFCNQSREDSDAIEQHFDLISAGSQHSSFYNWLFGIHDTTFVQDLDCIEKIDPQDADMDDSNFSTKYLVNTNDISNIKNQITSGVDTYLFRFKIDNSITMPICYSRKTEGPVNNFFRQDCGILAYEYHGVVDFDVLDLTFVDGENVLHNYPVVSSPTNVFPDIMTPYQSSAGCSGFWKTVLMILMILALILLVLFFLKWFIPWKRNRQMINAVKSSGKSANKNSSVNHYTYNIKKTYINKSSHKKRKKRRK